MMAAVRHATCSSGLTKFQADGFLFDWVYAEKSRSSLVFGPASGEAYSDSVSESRV